MVTEIIALSTAFLLSVSVSLLLAAAALRAVYLVVKGELGSLVNTTYIGGVHQSNVTKGASAA
jgi:hypothetical protein